MNLCAFWPDFSRYWVGSWSVISLACCTFTLLSFLIDVSRFAYPERPIIYLGACFAMIAVALVVGFAVGDDIACDDEAGREVTYLLLGE
jgi:frizzled protein 1/7